MVVFFFSNFGEEIMTDIFEQKERLKEERNLKFVTIFQVLLPYICTVTSLFPYTYFSFQCIFLGIQSIQMYTEKYILNCEHNGV